MQRTIESAASVERFSPGNSHCAPANVIFTSIGAPFGTSTRKYSTGNGRPSCVILFLYWSYSVCAHNFRQSVIIAPFSCTALAECTDCDTLACRSVECSRAQVDQQQAQRAALRQAPCTDRSPANCSAESDSTDRLQQSTPSFRSVYLPHYTPVTTTVAKREPK